QVREHVWWGADVDAQRSEYPSHTEQWLEHFNIPFRESEIEPVRLAPDDGRTAFDRLTAPSVEPTDLSELAAPDGTFALVSVVMPVYKPGPRLRTAVRSVLDQSWPNIEVVLCDDASTSGLEILEEVHQSDPRIRVSRALQNGGAYAARNRGLTVA